MWPCGVVWSYALFIQSLWLTSHVGDSILEVQGASSNTAHQPWRTLDSRSLWVRVSVRSYLNWLKLSLVKQIFYFFSFFFVSSWKEIFHYLVTSSKSFMMSLRRAVTSSCKASPCMCRVCSVCICSRTTCSLAFHSACTLARSAYSGKW